MAEVVSLHAHRMTRAAREGFREWKRLFRTMTDFDETTRWSDLPDRVILFLGENRSGSTFSFYDLLMRARGLGNGHDFTELPPKDLSELLNAYFLVLDRARFECMRRLGWVLEVPAGETPIIEQVMDPESVGYRAMLDTPAPTPDHPAYEEDAKGRGADRAALVRRHIPDALNRFRERVIEDAAGLPAPAPSGEDVPGPSESAAEPLRVLLPETPFQP